MNSLSWLLYWADVLPSLSSFICFLSFLLFVVSIAGTIAYLVFSGSLRKIQLYEKALDAWKTDNPETRGHAPSQWDFGFNRDEASDAAFVPSLRFFPYMATLFFIMWGASFLVPSKDTFYLIAASEAGEQAIQTPEFNKVRKVINGWLDDKIADAEEPAETNSTE